jgi:hypothetical protein
MRLQRSRAFAGIILLAVFVVLAAQFPKAIDAQENDFWVYYRTSARILSGDWASIFNLIDRSLPYRYLPLTLPLIEPLARMSLETARGVWFVLMWVAFAGSAWALYSILKLLESRNAHWITALSFVLCLRYFMDSLVCGQPIGVFTLTTLLGIKFWIENKTQRSTLFFWVPALLKVLPGITILLLFASQLKKNLGRSVLLPSAGLIVTLFVALVGIVRMSVISLSLAFDRTMFFFHDWAYVLVNTGTFYAGDTSKSQSIRSLLLRLLNDGLAESIWKVSLIVVTAALTTLIVRAKDIAPTQKLTTGAIGGAFVVLWMTESLPYQFGFLLPAVALLIKEAIDQASKSALTLSVLFAIFCSFSGTSIIGFNAAEKIHQLSIPTLVCLILFGYVIRVFLKQANSALQPSGR